MVEKVFEVGVPLEHCRLVRIDCDSSSGEFLVVFRFPFDFVFTREREV